MAEIRDEYGNPIQLTDAHGNPVQLTDEYGNPMHLTGVVTTTADADKRAASGKMTTDGTGTNGAGGALQHDQQEQQKQQNEEQKQQHEDKRSSSSSSSSSEDEGHGGNGDQVDQGVGGEQGRRRKKKGLKEKIKEKLTGGKHKDEHEHTAVTTHSHITSMHTAVTTHSPTGPGSEPHEHEKKGVMEKIKEKLPGHHTSS